MITTPPTLSVLLLCWNHSAYLEQCIAALAAQEMGGVELLFLDNVSTDGSAELAERLFAEHGLTATVLRNSEPAGVSANLNRLLAASSGELVAVLSTDDWYESGYVATMRQAATDNPAAGWFTCGGWYFFEDSGERRPIADDGFRSGFVTDALLDGEEPFNFAGCCYRRRALQEVGGWDPTLPIEDRDLFLRLSQHYPVVSLPDRLVNYRRASSTASANPAFMAAGFDAYFAKHRAAFGRKWRQRYASALRGPAAVAIDRGDLPLGRSLLRRALRLDPFNPHIWRTGLYWLRRRSAR